MGRQATQGPRGVWGIPDGVSFQSHQELHTSNVPPDTIWKRALEVQKRKNNLAFNPQLEFRWSLKVAGLRLTIVWSELRCGAFRGKNVLRGLEAYEFSMCCLELAEQGLLSLIWNNIIALLSLYVICASSELDRDFPFSQKWEKWGKWFACRCNVIENGGLKDPGYWLSFLLHFLILLLSKWKEVWAIGSNEEHLQNDVYLKTGFDISPHIVQKVLRSLGKQRVLNSY